MSFAERMYRLLLHVYPKSFRYEYGDEMLRAFEHRSRDENTLLLWLALLPDLLFTAVREHIDILRQDARYALRTFIRKPGFALTAILVVALAVGANTAIFSAVDYVLLRPLPFARAERLVNVADDASYFGYSFLEPAAGTFTDWKKQNTVFSGMAAYLGAPLNLTGSGTPERLQSCKVSAELLPLLGVSPMIGRSFLAEEDRDGAPGTVILGYGIWVRRFGGDPSILGRNLVLSGESYKVIGVMPQDFHFPRAEVDLWTPIRFDAWDIGNRDNHSLSVIARLRDGITIEKARAEMNVVGARLAAEYPKEKAHTGVALRELRDTIAPGTRLSLIVLLCAAGAVLLIGCANLANLLLARASGRAKELAVRGMLGAGAERLIRQVLTESVLLSAAGGLLGIIVASGTMPLLSRLVPAYLPISGTLPVDARVLGFGLLLSLATGIAFGLLPALQAGNEALLSRSKEGGREGVGGKRSGFRNALVIAEVSLSVVLLVSAGLLVRALLRMQQVDPGFHDRGVLTLRTDLPLPKYDNVGVRKTYYDAVLTQVRGLPGVQSASFTSFMPLTMRGGIFPVEVRGQTVDPRNNAMVREVTPGYFQTLGIPLLLGRDIAESDSAESLKIAIVSANFARKYWPGKNAAGEHFTFMDEERVVVGVAGEVKARGLERSSEPQVYLPYTQVKLYLFFAPRDLAIQSTGELMSLLPAVRRIIAAADPEQPVSDVRTLTELVERESSGRRDQLLLLGTFTALAFLLAALGIYGVLSFVVGQRSQEIGVRIALGATRSDILNMILRHGLMLASLGLTIGIAASFAAGQAMSRLLFGVEPHDPLVFLASGALCLIAAVIAALIPAIRAMRVDPIRAIRFE